MIECRRDKALDFVVDTDQDAVAKASELVVALAGADIPGFGIVHEPMPGDLHESVHEHHKNLVTEAILAAGGILKLREPFDSMGHPIGMGSHTNMHGDIVSHNNNWINVDVPGLWLRLHTTSPFNGANVQLVTTAPGLTERPADINMYQGNKLIGLDGSMRGYDGQDALFGSKVFYKLEEGDYDPFVSAPDVHHFKQTALSSVVFRSYASIGPVTAHSFQALDPATRRYAFVADVQLQSQSC